MTADDADEATARYIQTYILPDIERAELRGDPVSWSWIHDLLTGLAADLLPAPKGATT